MTKAWIMILGCVVLTQSVSAQAPKKLRALFEVAGQDSGARLGSYVRGVGDLNKDGYDDVAVSAPGNLLTYIYFGGAVMSQEPSLILQGGGSIASGDFNGDGWIDIAVWKWANDTIVVTLGAGDSGMRPAVVLAGEHVGDGFGSSIESGDINGDGIADFIVGAVGYPHGLPDASRGKIYVFAGGSQFGTVVSASFLGDTGRAGLGIISVGDVDGDESKDLIVMGYNQLVPSGEGSFFYVSVFLGRSNFEMQHNYQIDSRNVPGGFRDHVACFDADGDGIDDILVNKIYVFKGGSVLDTLPTYYIPPPNNDTTSFGPYPRVSGGGDFNGDGIKDILLGSSFGFSEGVPYGGVPGVFVMLGDRKTPGQYKAYRTYSDHWWGAPLFGRPENAGDVNGDGVDDIVVGVANEPIFKDNGFFGIYSGDTSLVTDVSEEPPYQPQGFDLRQNYPNPFNPETTIEFHLKNEDLVTLKVYDTLGREIITLVEGMRQSGAHRIVWDGTDRNGRKVATGLYYYRLQLQTSKRTYLKRAICVR